MTSPKACLIDVYDTLLTCDFTGHRTDMPRMAGVTAQEWNASYAQVEAELTDGRLSLAQGVTQMLIACGREPRPELVRQLARHEGDLLLTAARLYDDSIPFLQLLRSRGVMIAIVSNCGENTRALLDALGVTPLVDSLALSCEVGAAKPAEKIFRYALDQLGVAAEDAVFADDQPRYCAGAVQLGIRAVQINRAEPVGPPAPGSQVAQSLLELEPLFE